MDGRRARGASDGESRVEPVGEFLFVEADDFGVAGRTTRAQRVVHTVCKLTARQKRGRILAGKLGGGDRLLVAGNGGSAAQAQHLSAELVGRFQSESGAVVGWSWWEMRCWAGMCTVTLPSLPVDGVALVVPNVEEIRGSVSKVSGRGLAADIARVSRPTVYRRRPLQQLR